MSAPSWPSWLLLALVLLGFPLLASRSSRSGLLLAAPRRDLYLSIGLTHGVLLLLLLAVLRLEGRDLASLGLGPRLTPAALAAWTGTASAAGLLAFVAFRLLGRLLGAPPSPVELHLRPRAPRERWLFALLVAPAAGFVEELVFRGFVPQSLGPLVGGPWTGMLLGLTAFALGHVYQGSLGVLRAAAAGLVLGTVALATGSLWPAILAHTLVDLVGGLLLRPDGSSGATIGAGAEA